VTNTSIEAPRRPDVASAPELDDDVRLENRVRPPPSGLPSDERQSPNWVLVHRELRRLGVTLNSVVGGILRQQH
jgi:hypothetical protein